VSEENYITRSLMICTPHQTLPRVIKSMRWARHGARMGDRRYAYGVLVGEPEGRSPLGKPRRRWKYNIKMYPQDAG
jgi:hypothetical protein